MVLDPIIDGYRLTRVLMDGGSSLNLIYQDTVRRMGIDSSRISQSNTTFEGVIPGVEAYGRGSVVLEVIFGPPKHLQKRGTALHHRTFLKQLSSIAWKNGLRPFNALPHYGYLTLMMFVPRGVITISGITERSSRAEEYATARRTISGL